MKWIKSKEEYGPHNLEFQWKELDGTTYTVSTRPIEGCIHLRRTENEQRDEDDYIHICDLDKYISMLVELQKELTK